MIVIQKIVRPAFVLFLFGISFAMRAQNLVSDTVEKNALLSMYYNTNGANWSAAQRWTLSRINSFPDSTLYGITVLNGDIRAIQLSSVGMSGTLPAELNDLTELQTLQISNSLALTDTLPYLGGLTKLNTLDFSNTNFQGTIPSWITELLNLRSLSLSSYSMSGPIPSDIVNLMQLNSLTLNNVDLGMNNAIPDLFLDLPSLRSLSLAGCHLVPASLPAEGLSGLPLTSLDLSSNPSFVSPDGSFPDLLLSLPQLSSLFLRSNNLKKLPDHFQQLSQLSLLDLSFNNFSDSSRLSDVIDTLQLVTSLQTLQLTACQIKDLPNNFKNLSSLKSLNLNSNILESDGCAILGSLPVIQAIYISGNGLTDLPPELSNLTTLQTLDASNNKLNPVPDVLNDIQGLKNLILSNNTITSLPEWFGTGEMHTLSQLTMDNNKIVLPLPDSLAHLTNLTMLSMANNLLQGVLPSYFSDFTKINFLNLSFNQLESPLPDFSRYTNLNYVYLQHNILTGAVPAALSNQTVAKLVVNLSFNHFDEMTPFKSASNMTVIVNNNRLDFTNILKVTRPVLQYIYVPQDTVVSLNGQPAEIKVYEGGTLNITAGIDTGLQPPSQYQWFKYVDGVHDIPLTAGPSTSINYQDGNFSSSEGGQYYYHITNPAAPGLVLTSPIILVTVHPCVTDAVMDITYQQYVCAFIFNAPANTDNCQSIAYHWNFGDNKSSAEKNPVHGYMDAGTYTVSLSLTFRCGTSCQSDTTIQKQITYSPIGEAQLFKDSLVIVSSDIRQQIISASASTFADVWPLQYTNASLSVINNFVNGTRGVWRNEGSYVYKTDRSQSSIVDISKDGTFDLEQFNWQQAGMDAIPGWIKASSMTQYSPFSYELENEDVLGIHSGALYDYGGHLPSANGVNMSNKEMAFTSFEYLEGSVSGNWIIGTQSVPAYKMYNVISGIGNMALIDAKFDQVEEAQLVDVIALRLGGSIFKNPFNYITNDSIVCRQIYPYDHRYTAMIVKEAPFTGLWTGRVMVRSQLNPIVTPDIDNAIAHSGKSSLHVTSVKTFKQGILQLDSAKTYMINAWVSVNNPNVAVPKLADELGIDVIVKNKKGIVKNTFPIVPSGPVIEGWQQVKGTFTVPIDEAQLEISFKPGSNGQAWYDDLRLHPEKGNMKSYVYDLNDYRLTATHDEENFSSFYYYDKEGNLYLVKKETEKGVKTISENVTWIGK
jgi:Leucine-rich repeat (LRR) protein/PKD repeat protein